MIRQKLTSQNHKQVIGQAAQALKKGGLVVFPSDTVYGLGVDPTNPSAVTKLFQIKSRQLTKAVSVLVSNQKMAGRYVEVNSADMEFYGNFFPGPFTVISKVKTGTDLDQRIYSYLNTLGIRIPDFPFLLKLSQAFGKPITATSANISGQSPHYTVDSFLNTLSNKRQKLIDLVIDMGKLPRRQPSTVVDLSQGEIKELRSGDISFGASHRYMSQSDSQTRQIAYNLVQKNYQTDGDTLLFALVGELGSGKTTFCQGIGQYFNLSSISSPTFLITKEYPLPKGTFFHIDTYRLENENELKELGFKKMIKPGNIIAVEWAQKAKNIIQKQKNTRLIWVFLSHHGLDKREIKVFMPLSLN